MEQQNEEEEEFKKLQLELEALSGVTLEEKILKGHY